SPAASKGVDAEAAADGESRWTASSPDGEDAAAGIDDAAGAGDDDAPGAGVDASGASLSLPDADAVLPVVAVVSVVAGEAMSDPAAGASVVPVVVDADESPSAPPAAMPLDAPGPPREPEAA